jgi:hypothetical protein
MENTFDLKKFLVENKLTTNSRLLTEVEQSVEIANKLKKLKADTEAVITMAKSGIEDQEKWAGMTRDANIDAQAVEQQIEVVEDILEKIEDYAGDGWASDIEDVAREKSIPELQMMLKNLVKETDKLNLVYTGKPLQEEDLTEGWKQWALGAISALSVLGGGTAQAATYNTVDTNQPGTEVSVQQGKYDESWQKFKSDIDYLKPRISKFDDVEKLEWSLKHKGKRATIGLNYYKDGGSLQLTMYSQDQMMLDQLIATASKAGMSVKKEQGMVVVGISKSDLAKFKNLLYTVPFDFNQEGANTGEYDYTTKPVKKAKETKRYNIY